tara:strand:+ start:286 stop:498 length:213 start_codon:yes stop_codon:yes gene_type:complete
LGVGVGVEVGVGVDVGVGVEVGVGVGVGVEVGVGVGVVVLRDLIVDASANCSLIKSARCLNNWFTYRDNR